MRSPWTTLHVFLVTCLVTSLILLWGQVPGATHESRAAEREAVSASSATASGPVAPAELRLDRLSPRTRDPFFRNTQLQPSFVLRFPQDVVQESSLGSFARTGRCGSSPRRRS